MKRLSSSSRIHYPPQESIHQQHQESIHHPHQEIMRTPSYASPLRHFSPPRSNGSNARSANGSNAPSGGPSSVEVGSWDDRPSPPPKHPGFVFQSEAASRVLSRPPSLFVSVFWSLPLSRFLSPTSSLSLSLSLFVSFALPLSFSRPPLLPRSVLLFLPRPAPNDLQAGAAFARVKICQTFLTILSVHSTLFKISGL